MFGVSRLSVREGVKALIGMGLVEARHGRGYFVVGGMAERYRSAVAAWLIVRSDELIDMYDVRGALTTLAAQHALRRTDPAAIERIVEAHDAFIEAVDRDADAQELAGLDVRFHRSIAEASGSPLITSLLNELYDRLEEPRQAIMALPGHRERPAREHEAIVEALRSHDPVKVARAVDRHIASVSATIRAYDGSASRALSPAIRPAAGCSSHR